MKKLFPYLFVSGCLLGASCSEIKSAKQHAPIVLGDSSTIVTETDSAYLKDMVMDMEPAPAPVPAQAESPAPAAANLNRSETAITGNGFTVDFGGEKAVFTGITAIEFQQQDPKNDPGLSYARRSGSLAQSDLVLEGLKNVRVTQRYQTELSLSANGKTLPVSSLGVYLSEWETLKGKSDGSRWVFDLSFLSHPAYKKFSNAELKKAVRTAANREKLSRSALNDWLSRIRRTNDAGDAPCRVTLHHVQFRITATDLKGNRWKKTIRIDN